MATNGITVKISADTEDVLTQFRTLKTKIDAEISEIGKGKSLTISNNLDAVITKLDTIKTKLAEIKELGGDMNMVFSTGGKSKGGGGSRKGTGTTPPPTTPPADAGITQKQTEALEKQGDAQKKQAEAQEKMADTSEKQAVQAKKIALTNQILGDPNKRMAYAAYMMQSDPSKYIGQAMRFKTGKHVNQPSGKYEVTYNGQTIEESLGVKNPFQFNGAQWASINAIMRGGRAENILTGGAAPVVAPKAPEPVVPKGPELKTWDDVLKNAVYTHPSSGQKITYADLKAREKSLNSPTNLAIRAFNSTRSSLTFAKNKKGETDYLFRDYEHMTKKGPSMVEMSKAEFDTAKEIQGIVGTMTTDMTKTAESLGIKKPSNWKFMRPSMSADDLRGTPFDPFAFDKERMMLTTPLPVGKRAQTMAEYQSLLKAGIPYTNASATSAMTDSNVAKAQKFFGQRNPSAGKATVDAFLGPMYDPKEVAKQKNMLWRQSANIRKSNERLSNAMDYNMRNKGFGRFFNANDAYEAQLTSDIKAKQMLRGQRRASRSMNYKMGDKNLPQFFNWVDQQVAMPIKPTQNAVQRFRGTMTGLKDAFGKWAEDIAFDPTMKALYRGRDFFRQMQSTGYGMTAGISAPIIGAMAGATWEGISMEKSMRVLEVNIADNFSKAINPTEELGVAMGELSQKAYELSQVSVYTPQEIIDAETEFVRLGNDEIQTKQAIESVTRLAEIENINLAESAYIVSSAINGFGMEAADAEEVVTTLAKASVDSALTVEMLGHDFAYASSSARTAGWSIQETAAAMESMAKMGIAPYRIGFYVRGIADSLMDIYSDRKLRAKGAALGINLTDASGQLKDYASIVDEFQNLRERMGYDPNKLNKEGKKGDWTNTSGYAKYISYMDTFFPREQRMAVMANLDAQLEVTDRLLGSQKDITVEMGNQTKTFTKGDMIRGSWLIAYYTQQNKEATIELVKALSSPAWNTTAGSLNKMKNAAISLGIAFAESSGLLGAVDELAKGVTNLMLKMKAFFNANPQAAKLALVFGVMVAAIGPLVAIFGTLGTILANVGLGMLMMKSLSMTLGAQLGVTGLRAVLTTVAMQGLRALFMPLAGLMGGVSSAISGLAGALSTLALPITIAIAVLAALAAGFVWLYKVDEQFKASVDDALAPFAQYKEAFTAMGGVLNWFGGIFKWVGDAVVGTATVIVAILAVIGDAFWKALGTNIMGMVEALIAPIGALYRFIVGLIDVAGHAGQIVGSIFRMWFGGGNAAEVEAALMGYNDAIKKWGQGIIYEVFRMIEGVVKMFTGSGLDMAKDWLKNNLGSIYDGFVWLYNVLVGHSIVPDLVNGILYWFMLLPNKVKGVFDFITGIAYGLGAAVGGIFGGKTDIGKVGSNMVKDMMMGLKTITRPITQFFAAIFSNNPFAKDILGKLFGPILEAVDTMIATMTVFFQLIVQVLALIGEDMIIAVTTMATALGNMLNATGVLIGEMLNLLIQGFVELGNVIYFTMTGQFGLAAEHLSVLINDIPASALVSIGKFNTEMIKNVDILKTAFVELGVSIENDITLALANANEKLVGIIANSSRLAQILSDVGVDLTNPLGITPGSGSKGNISSTDAIAMWKEYMRGLGVDEKFIRNEMADPGFIDSLRTWVREKNYIPAFAYGGVVTKPTVGLIGEAGPEAVIPLSDYGTGGGRKDDITIRVPIYLDSALIGEQIVDAARLRTG